MTLIERIQAKGPKKILALDGGITTYNNPAFQALLMATVEPYNLTWPAGEDNILIVSVGTGTSPDANADLHPDEMNLLYSAALNEQDFLCRTFGKCLAGDMLDQEIGDMIGKKGPVSPKLFIYMRYNAELTKPGLEALGITDVEPTDVQKLDSAEHIPALQRIGREVAAWKLDASHYRQFL